MDCSSLFTLATALFTLTTAVATAWAAFAAQKAVHATRQATRLQVMNTLFSEYASDKMRAALRELAAWREKHGSDFVEQFSKLKEEEPSKFEKLDGARRHVAHHYEKLHALWKEGGLEEKVVRRLATKRQVCLFVKVVKPLEKALNPQYEEAAFRDLDNLYDISSVNT